MTAIRTWFPVWVCALLLLVSSCVNSNDKLSKLEAFENVAGTWVGTTSAGETVVLVLSQTLEEVTGTAVIGDASGPLTGTMDGDRLEATVASQPVFQIFSTATSNSISGTLRDFRANIVGSFRVERQ